jgi:hypothetical protein
VATTPVVSQQSPLEILLTQRRELMRRGLYDVLGTIALAQTANGKINFKQSGPTLALPKGEIGKPWEEVDFSTPLIVSPWEGKLPDVLDTKGKLDEPCPDCLASCDDCKGKGRIVCNWAGCAGGGQINTKIIECPAAGCAKDTGKANPDCQACGGSGMGHARNKCRGCQGTGEIACPRCAGTGKYPTGNRRGSKDWRQPACKSCNGNGRKTQTVAQDWRKFADAIVEGKYLALGPISHLHVERGMDYSLDFAVEAAVPVGGGRETLLFLLLESPKAGAMMFAVGGTLRRVLRF